MPDGAPLCPQCGFQMSLITGRCPRCASSQFPRVRSGGTSTLLQAAASSGERARVKSEGRTLCALCMNTVPESELSDVNGKRCCNACAERVMRGSSSARALTPVQVDGAGTPLAASSAVRPAVRRSSVVLRATPAAQPAPAAASVPGESAAPNDPPTAPQETAEEEAQRLERARAVDGLMRAEAAQWKVVALLRALCLLAALGALGCGVWLLTLGAQSGGRALELDMQTPALERTGNEISAAGVAREQQIAALKAYERQAYGGGAALLVTGCLLLVLWYVARLKPFAAFLMLGAPALLLCLVALAVLGQGLALLLGVPAGLALLLGLGVWAGYRVQSLTAERLNLQAW